MITDTLDAVRQETLGTSPEGTVRSPESKTWSWGWETDPRLFLSWRLSHVLCIWWKIYR